MERKPLAKFLTHTFENNLKKVIRILFSVRPVPKTDWKNHVLKIKGRRER